MSPLLVLSVTVVLLLASRPVHPVAAFAPTATLRHDWRRAASRTLADLMGPSLAVEIGSSGGSQSPQPESKLPGSTRAARAAGYRDPLAPYRAIVGPEAHTPLHIRARAVILLILIVAFIGAAIAGVFLLVIASGRFVLELLAG